MTKIKVPFCNLTDSPKTTYKGDSIRSSGQKVNVTERGWEWDWGDVQG